VGEKRKGGGRKKKEIDSPFGPESKRERGGGILTYLIIY